MLSEVIIFKSYLIKTGNYLVAVHQIEASLVDSVERALEPRWYHASLTLAEPYWEDFTESDSDSVPDA